MHKRILLLFGVASIIAGMVSAVPAAAASPATSVPPGQVLSKAQFSGTATPANGAASQLEGSFANGTDAAFTDDPALLLQTINGRLSTSEFPRNSASGGTRSSEGAPGDHQEGAARSVKGLNAFDLASTHGFVVEPPDQGLCTNGERTIEMVNLNLKVFDENMNALSGPIVLETFFGDPLDGGVVPGTDVTIQGDPRCLWDAGTGRWFLSQLVVDLTKATSVFQIAVSTTDNPLGTYNIYTVDNTDNSNPGCPCLGDQPTLGVNQDALFVSTNEFGIFSNEFNGSVVYTLDKHAMAEGEPAANVVTDFVGLTVPTPEWTNTQNCLAPIEGLFCWATLRPAYGPTDLTTGGGERRLGGVEYLLSALDFANVNDNRIAVWAVTNTRSIRSDNPNIHITHQVLGSEPYVFPTVFAPQKAGPIPLGDSGRYSCRPIPCSHPTPQPEGGIQPNDDQFGSATFAGGLLWGALNTQMPSGQLGSAYFIVRPHWKGSSLSGSSIVNQNYLLASGSNDVLFPSIGVNREGQGVISFTLTGPDFFPSSAYARIDREGAGKIRVAALGQSPQDGFSEYRDKGTPFYRPRWGDYTAAFAVGDRFVFSSEYIQFANCSDAAFKLDTTCGGTRSRSANWGTSVNTVSASEEGKD